MFYATVFYFLKIVVDNETRWSVVGGALVGHGLKCEVPYACADGDEL
jgi:hypothetical protein